jgi:hypothetical protein
VNGILGIIYHPWLKAHISGPESLLFYRWKYERQELTEGWVTKSWTRAAKVECRKTEAKLASKTLSGFNQGWRTTSKICHEWQNFLKLWRNWFYDTLILYGYLRLFLFSLITCTIHEQFLRILGQNNCINSELYHLIMQKYYYYYLLVYKKSDLF